jgi:hypothetical protein
MAKRCAVVNLGVRNPLSDAFSSKTALGSGVEVPIPMLSCANTCDIENNKTVNRIGSALFMKLILVT